jgi:very-short-patch-repair endonuclease
LIFVFASLFGAPYSCGDHIRLDGGSAVTGRGAYRESELPEVPPERGTQVIDGRRFISVIGIDQYRAWGHLNNAVNDARGVLAAFEQLGFAPVVAPLLDDAATGDAIRCIPARLAPKLDGDDSLVVFFAGHGHTTTARFPDGDHISTGYLIPVDADRDDKRVHTWQRIEHWLTTIAELPPRHILVILDSCHSGIALGRSIAHRGVGVRSDGSSKPFHERRSRRILTSALDDQRAMDGGPVAGHSVFTGCLIEALRGGTGMRHESSAVGVNEIAEYVRRRVREHSQSQQVPGLGVLELDDSGELLLSLQQAREVSRPQPPGPPGTERPHRGSRAQARQLAAVPDPPRLLPRAPEARRASPEATRPRAVATPSRGETARLPDRTEGWTLDPVLATALDRHGEERRRGAHVLTIVAGAALAAQTSWGTWAARHGYLTLATQSVGLDAVVADLLAQTPWLRCVPEARKRLAAAARVDVQAVDASLDARSMSERRMWIDDVAGLDPHARVSGWLLSWLRHAAARAPDLTTAPVRPGELLAIACDLASPTAVLLFHPTPDEQWLERAVVTAAELIAYLPAHSVAVTAPDELVTRMLRDHRPGTAWTMARQGLLRVDALARRLPGRARHSTMRVLFEALARDPRTRGRFELDGKVVTEDGPAIDVALVAHADRIAVELDGWYHFHDPEGYRRDRVQDTRLLRAGYFVLRFPTEDVDDRLASTIEHLAIALAGRRAARALL